MGLIQLCCSTLQCAERVLSWASITILLTLLMVATMVLMMYGVSVGYKYSLSKDFNKTKEGKSKFRYTEIAGTGSYQCAPLNSATSISVSIKGPGFAVVGLSPVPTFSENILDISIGAHYNQYCTLSYSDYITLLTTYTPNILNEDKFVEFWIYWADDHVLLKRVGESPDWPILSLPNAGLGSINYICVRYESFYALNPCVFRIKDIEE